ncbi:MAG: LexA family transcriptional regulator [Pseudomonadota bacterium]
MAKESVICEILKTLMFKGGLKTAQLARKINVPQQTLQRIVSGVSPRPHPSTLLPIAKHFSITVEQLKGEEPIPSLEQPLLQTAHKSKMHTIPLVSWEVLQDRGTTPAHELASITMIQTDAKISVEAIALKVNDASMEPIFPEGTTIVVDPQKEVKDRRYVVAYLKASHQVVFRQLLINAGERYLKPMSPDFNQFSLGKLSADDEIIGVLAQAKVDFVE